MLFDGQTEAGGNMWVASRVGILKFDSPHPPGRIQSYILRGPYAEIPCQAQLIFSVDFDSLLAETAAGSKVPSASRLEPGGFCLTHDGACDPWLSHCLTAALLHCSLCVALFVKLFTQDLLDCLLAAYEDPGFQQQVAKLARDVRWDVEVFRQNLPKVGHDDSDTKSIAASMAPAQVALGPQREVLLRFGFEASLAGANAAQQALEAAALPA